MTESFDFLKEYEFQVEVFDDVLGELGSGTLSFGAGNWTHLSFPWTANYRVLPEGEIQRRLKAKSTDGSWFTLFNCKRIDNSIGVTYLVEGDVNDNFSRIEIRYSDISEWFMPWQRLEGIVGESICWSNRTKHLSTTVKTKHDNFSLSSKSETSTVRTGEDIVLHEHVLFTFESLKGHYFSPEDMQTKALELSNLLSILIAYPLSIVSVEVVCEKDIAHRAFFSTFKRYERDTSDKHFFRKCFIQEQVIHDRWESIFNHYFNSAYRKVTWTRLSGMQRYEGFWEYRALGYVSLLDMYVDQRSRENKRKKIAVPLSSKAKAKLDTKIKTVIPKLAKSQHASVMTIVSDFFIHDRDLDFGEKYRSVTSACDQDILKIINITEKDFKLIKDVRNKIAHGKALDLPESDLLRISTIIDKIVLLMTYWAFIDFGLTNDDFLSSLKTTFSSLRYSADPDSMHIDRMTNPESFLSVSKETFDKVSCLKNRTFVCFTEDASGAIEFSEEFSTAYRNWMSSTAHKSAVTAHAEIFGVAQDRIRYFSPGYIDCGDECQNLASVWVIKAS